MRRATALTHLSADTSAQRNNSTTSSRRLVPSRTSSRRQAGENTQPERRSASRSEKGGEEAVDSEARPRRQRSLLDVPGQPSVADEDPSLATTGLSGDTIKGSEGSIGKGSRGSQRSITGKRRAGSTASSQRSQRAARMAQEKPSGNTPASDSPTTLTDQRPKKGGSRFVSLLCCGLIKDGNLVEDDEEALAAKKTSTTLPDRTAIPAVQKPDANTPESSTAESKEPVNEKVGESAKIQEVGPVNEKVEPLHGAQVDHIADRFASPSGLDRKSSRGRQPADQSSQAFQAARLEIDLSTSHNQLQSSGPQIAIQAPTPITAANEEMIHDRTPQQERRDSDIEMTDAGPSVPLSANDVSGTSEDAGPQPAHRDASQIKIDLPPPPPLSERVAQITPPHSPPGGVQDGQKWLLPPIRPELIGRKCLVLDLDETLVHSSFKVRPTESSPSSNPLIRLRSCTKRTLRFRSRSRVNITTST